MDPEGQDIVHQVITIGHGIEHRAYPALLFARRDILETEICGAVFLHGGKDTTPRATRHSNGFNADWRG